MADKVEILLRARGGRQVAAEAGMASRSFSRMERASVLANKAGGKLGTVMRGLGRGALYAGGAIAGGLVIEVKRGTEAWEEHRKITSDVRQAIKTTGGAANVSAKHIDKLANAIQAKTAVDDDVVASGQRVLLTFTRVANQAGKGNKVFDRATKLAVDMAARFGTDTKGAFVQLGKALDDPIKGITALRRSGVSFTDAERDKIKTLEETGHHLEAQRMILAALDKQVGGSAKAQATPIAKLKQSWGDLEKELGRVVAPTVDKVAGKMQHLVDDASGIMGRKDLTLTAKLKLFGRRDLEPEVDKLGAALRRAKLGDELQHAVELASPKIATGFAHAAPRAASAFVHSFGDMDIAARMLTTAYLMKKFGPSFSTAGTRSGRRFGGKFGPAMLLSILPFVPEIVDMIEGEISGKQGAKGEGVVKGRARVKVDRWIYPKGSGGPAVRQTRPAPGLPWTTAEVLRRAGTSKTIPRNQWGKLGIPRRMEGDLTSKPGGWFHPAKVKGSGPAHDSPAVIVKQIGTATRNATKDLPGKTGKSVRDGTKHLDKLPEVAGRSMRASTRNLERLPERVAGAVARRPLDVNVVSEITVPVEIDGEKVANIIARRNGKHRDRR